MLWDNPIITLRRPAAPPSATVAPNFLSATQSTTIKPSLPDSPVARFEGPF